MSTQENKSMVRRSTMDHDQCERVVKLAVATPQRWVLVGLLSAALIGLPSALAPERVAANQTDGAYTVIDLGRGGATAINDAGQLVGDHYSAPAQAMHAVLLEPDSPMTDLGTLPGHTTSRAEAINESGQIVGWSATAGREQTHAVFWDHEMIGMITDLGTLPGHTDSRAEAINEAGQIVGWSSSATDGVERAVLWQEGKIIDLGGLDDGVESHASGINDAGLVVGWSATASGAEHAVLWEEGKIIDLGTLPDSVRSHASGINNAGQIVGYASRRTSTGEFENHAVLWEDGESVDLGGPGEGLGTQADEINEAGQVVGGFGNVDVTATGIEGAWQPAMWERGEGGPSRLTMVQLPPLPDFLSGSSHAEGINNDGLVVGYYGDHAVLWIPGQ
jgi:probable HAF family extracellular repeat protein